MQGNDLDNTPSPMVYVVWEGLIATTGEMGKVQKYVKMRRFEKALALFQPHYVAIDAMWQAMNRGGYGISVVTHLPEAMAAFLPNRLDMDVVPYRELLTISPGDLVHKIPHMPWLLGIADPELYRARAYGSFGRHVPVEHAYLIGNLY